MGRGIAALIALWPGLFWVALFWAGLFWAGSGLAASAACAPDRVIVDTGTARQEFSIELADTEGARAQGLMNRAHMASAAGMLFAYPQPQRAQFWMENTLIALDMIFAGPDGTVLGVHENAVPMDRSVIDGGAGVQYVLEINGGLARRMGIAAGSALHHPVIAGSDCAAN